jgi:hypothetical protein
MAENKAVQKRPDAERYREAAENALQQLDWCIGYLHRIHKVGISKTLARNRNYIRTHLMDRPEQPLPTAQVGRD